MSTRRHNSIGLGQRPNPGAASASEAWLLLRGARVVGLYFMPPPLGAHMITYLLNAGYVVDLGETKFCMSIRTAMKYMPI